MVILITGASHTGKTLLAQRLMERHGISCLSLDHLKMGLIRGGFLELSPEDDDGIEARMWPVVRGIIETAIENGQSLIIEGCYIPFDWAASFSQEYLEEIKCFCLVMTERYIAGNFVAIKGRANVIERRQDDRQCTLENVMADNERYLKAGWTGDVEYVIIDERYDVDINLPWRPAL